MTDKKASNLNDFFKKHTKKTSTKKKEPKPLDEEPAAADLATAAAAQEETKTAPKVKKQAAAEYESSDEEKTDLTFGDDQATIKDRKQVEAEKRRAQDDSEGVGQGWRALDNQAKQAQEARLASTAAGKPEGGKGGEMKFGAKPVFSNKSKAGLVGAKNEFPEIGSVSQMQDGKGAAPARSETGPSYDFVSSTAKAREEAPREERKPATKPVFTSSKKKNLAGGADLAEIANSKQNYDFAGLGSTAKSTVSKPREEGDEADREERQRTNRDRFQQQAARVDLSAEDDFEVVREKKRQPQGSSGEMSFGKPSFSRSNK